MHPSLPGTGATAVAQPLRVCLPAHLPQLLINEIACLSLSALTQPRRPLGLPAPLLRLHRRGSGRRLFRLCQQFFLLPFLHLSQDSPLRGQLIGTALIVPIPISLHEPFGKAVSHRQQGLAIPHGFIVLMDSLVPRLSQGMEHIREVRGNKPLPQQRLDALVSPIIPWQGQSVIGENKVHDSFPYHAQLHQTGVGIAIAIPLRHSAEARQDGEFILQK